MNTLKLGPLYRRSVGFDHFADLLQSLSSGVEESSSNYPPYNIEKFDDERYGITMAVAGFSSENLEIEQVKNELTVKGQIHDDEHQGTYLHKGIAHRAFTQKFRLADNVEVGQAKIEHGLLQIELHRIIPEAAKPRKIEINQSQAAGQSKLFDASEDQSNDDQKSAAQPGKVAAV